MTAPIDVAIQKGTEAIVLVTVAVWAFLKVRRSFKKDK
jgi:hypothetical protein